MWWEIGGVTNPEEEASMFIEFLTCGNEECLTTDGCSQLFAVLLLW